ncbi:GumC family protein [Pseudophaeobacter arcticus]|uniref:GumC family protein n=1 Tax=Pseudophaeobacter arcticus TaxID=385492 RepID=UPI0003FB9EB1|nr:polysaccharide biosynthesis tyrosine autokinase [Pseudophaeobacter arcticus]
MSTFENMSQMGVSSPVQRASQAAQPLSDDGIDLGQLLRTLWRGKFWILISMLVAILVGGYYAYAVAVPLYSTTSVVTLENRQEQVVDFESVVSGLGGDQTSINTEVEILRSRALIKKLVIKLDLMSDPEFNISLREDTGFSVSGVIDGVKNLLLGAPDPKPDPTEEQLLETVTTAVRSAISISNIRNTYVFNLRVTTEGAQKSKLMANTLADLYVLNQLDVKFEATQRATAWLSERVADLQVDLENSEARAKEFNAGTELISPEVLEGLNRQAKDTRERLKTTSDRISVVSARIADMQVALDGRDRAEMARLANNPTLTQSLARVEAGTTPAELFDSQFEQIQRSETVSLSRLQTQAAGLKQSLVTIDGQIERQSKDLVTLQQLTREAEAARSIYEYFLGRLKETSVQQGIQQADSRVLSQAVLPDVPSAPKKSRVLAFSAILGAIAGVAGLLLREFMSNSFRSAQQLQSATGFTVLGQVPKFPGRKRRGVIEYLKEKPTSAGAEAIRNLRTSVMLSNVDKPPQVIMLTSSIPGEGKTTLSLALAQSFSGLNKKVLLIEGDLRRLVFSEYFEAEPNKKGLVSVLSGESTFEEAIRSIDIVGTDVLLGEKTQANVADLFESERFANLMELARSKYDIILIDTPPVLVVPDARTIAQHADSLLFAVRWDSTSQEQVAEGIRMLASVNIRPTGVVLSQIDMKGMKRYGYGGQYGAYSQYGRKYYVN